MKDNAGQLQKVIEDEPEKSFVGRAKDKAVEIVKGALEDIAKDKVKEAAIGIVKISALLGPALFNKTKPFIEFFENLLRSLGN